MIIYQQKHEQMEYNKKERKKSKWEIKADKFASEQQMESDRLAIYVLDIKKTFGLISVAQSICDFNLSWLYSLSPNVVVHEHSLTFFCENIKMFKRKLTIKEFMRFDTIVNHNEPKDFDEFKSLIT